MPLPGALVDPSSVIDRSVTLHVDGHELELYVARPAQPGRYPAIVVIHEAFGLNDHIRDVTRRFAAQGYIAGSPDLLARVGGAPDSGDMPGVMAMLGRHRDADAIADLLAAVASLRELDGCTGKVGAVGFCAGGRLALLLATQPGALDAAVDCWGGRITRRTLPPDEAHPEVVVERVAEHLACPLLGLFGADDQNPDAADITELRRALAAGGHEHRIVVYPDAGHAFFADYRPSYREVAAFAAWKEMLAWFTRLQ